MGRGGRFEKVLIEEDVGRVGVLLVALGKVFASLGAQDLCSGHGLVATEKGPVPRGLDEDGVIDVVVAPVLVEHDGLSVVLIWLWRS